MSFSELPMNITRAIFTGIRNGELGGTFNVDGKIVPTTGYFIGGAVPSLINPTPAQVLEFIETSPSDYVGYWEDSATNALYIDAVDHVHTEYGARRLAELRSEIAYWDARKGAEVRV